MAGNGLYETDLLTRAAPPCTGPGQEVYLPTVNRDASRRPVLTIQDPNWSNLVTGYNVYRAPAPAGPWTKIATNAKDSDPGTPGIQYVDPNGGGTATWYYLVAAFNGGCGLEGPW